MEDNASLLEKLVCFNCQNYLSYFPIYSDVNQKSICGRCQQFDTQNFYHNEIYEQSMEAFEFPCTYSKNGCKESCLLPKDIPKHEDVCEFRQMQCPANNDSTNAVCDWKGLTCDIYEHFEEHHPQFILQDGKFEADFVSNYKGVFLYAFGQYYFIVTKTSDAKNVGTVNFAYTGNDPDVKKYNYKITYKNANGAKSIDVVGKIGETVKIDGEMILDLLGEPFSIIAEITLYEETDTNNVDGTKKERNPAVNYEIIESMKCTVSLMNLYIYILVESIYLEILDYIEKKKYIGAGCI